MSPISSLSLSVRNLAKTFLGGRVVALNDINLEAGPGEFVTLLGPSGCGKTTILRCVAGLETADRGEIVVGDRTVFSSVRKINPPPEKRRMSMVFQSYAVWPHLTVFENVAYPLRRLKRVPPPVLKERTQRALELVGLQEMSSRYPSQLSGGQQQRVALARAVITEPDVLLFDEPLSNLDATLRERMRFEIRALQRRLESTAVYVTHDQSEAMTMSDRIAVINAGRIEQVGTPAEIYDHPVNRFVAGFVGLTNFIPGRVVGGDDAGLEVETALGTVKVAARPSEVYAGAQVVVSIRPEHVALQIGRPAGIQNVWEARVEQVLYLGDRYDLRIRVIDSSLRVQTLPEKSVHVGERYYAAVPPDKCVLIAEQ